MADFEVNGIAYRSMPMGAITQMKVARRLAPVLSDIVATVERLSPDIRGDNDKMSGIFLEMVTTAAAKIDDEAIDFITQACLSLCHRAAPSGNKFVPVWNAQAGKVQIDLAMPEMLGVCSKVIQAEMGGFFSADPTSLSPPLPRQ